MTRWLALFGALAGCDQRATWHCVDGSADILLNGEMSCRDWKERGDQLLDGFEEGCEVACTCAFVDVTCEGPQDD